MVFYYTKRNPTRYYLVDDRKSSILTVTQRAAWKFDVKDGALYGPCTDIFGGLQSKRVTLLRLQMYIKIAYDRHSEPTAIVTTHRGFVEMSVAEVRRALKG